MTKFSLKKKLLPSLMAASLASGVAFSGGASAIEVAADKTGQVLLAPFYNVQEINGQAQGPVYIKVINTSKTHAVKARIAFRSKVNSTEVLDFILYLSPTDVWRGMVVNDKGQAYVKSTDDSVRNLPKRDSFASIAGTPANVMMFDDGMAAGDTNEMGHFEIIGAYSVSGNVQTPKGNVLVERDMSKYDLAKVFDINLGSTSKAGSLLNLNAGSCPNNATAPCMIRTDEPSTVQLRGEVSFDLLGERFSYVMTALDESNSGKVISNPTYDLDTSQVVDLGVGFGILGGDNILEIETALAASSYSASNDSSSIVFVTFPTKYRHNRDVCNSGVTGAGWKPPFNATGSVTYTIDQYNNQEKALTSTEISVSGGQTASDTAITDEVEWFIPKWAFKSGWYALQLQAVKGINSCPYTGVPAIVNTMTFRGNQSELVENSPN